MKRILMLRSVTVGEVIPWSMSVRLYDSESYETGLDEISGELDVGRRAMFNAREKLGLERKWDKD